MGDQAPPHGHERLRPNLYSLPAGLPFLDTLADAILNDRLDIGIGGDDPAALARLTVYLPTRRAARALAHVLLRQSGRPALILPRLVPLGDPAEAEIAETLPGVDGSAPEAAEVADLLPVAPLVRQMLLARQIRAASAALDTAAGSAPDGSTAVGSLAVSALGSAFALARDLGAILDGMQAEDVPFERLATLDATRFDVLWQLTARFLAILGGTWPAILAERGECDPIAWRNRLLQRQAEALTTERPGRPVIVAGSTGSMRATARLIATVARLPRGAVVLPDLDLDSSEAVWSALAASTGTEPDRAASHPQAQLLRLMQEMRAAREDVRALGSGTASAARLTRRRLAHEALRAADATDGWRDLPTLLPAHLIEQALDSLTVIEAPDERSEALAVAAVIKRCLDTPAQTVALVTPDRGLAERVSLELRRWNIAVADSAGQDLARTQAGHLLTALLDAASHGVNAEAVMSLLHHPRVRLGLQPVEFSTARQALEIGALRGARPFLGLDGLARAVSDMPGRVADWRSPAPCRRLTAQDQAMAAELQARLDAALAPLLGRAAGQPGDLADRLELARRALDALSLDETGASHAFAGRDGEALAMLLDELSAAMADVDGTIEDLALICRDSMAGRVVRTTLSGEAHPRVTLLGLLEARLMSADVMILGGLNEGGWPGHATTDPFLNRAMRAELGLSSPERRIGQNAHDFIQGFASEHVVMSRALKSGGVQALPSRFWQRLKAVCPAGAWQEAMARGAVLNHVAAALDRPDRVSAVRRPEPKPPVALQPVSFSVTEVEKLFRDPYAVFARRILELTPLEPLAVALGASDRGSLMHEVLERFGRAWPQQLPPDPAAILTGIGAEVFGPLMGEADVQGFWWPRFCRLVPEIVSWEQRRRRTARRVGVELRAESAIALADGSTVTLSGRADRIEVLEDGRLAIIDFKTGQVPTARQQKAGLAPQLPLEAALAALAPFSPAPDRRASEAALGPASAAEAIHVALKPGLGDEPSSKRSAETDLGAEAARHLDGFRAMVLQFRTGARGFTSRFAPEHQRHDGDFDRLARVKEWSSTGEDSDA